MLTSLHIENIAVIEQASIDLGIGLNILTGETGAGKSMVIDAINVVLGERISRDIVRTGSDQARVTAVFSDVSTKICKKLDDLGYSVDEDGVLLIQRTISAEGKGNCRINGQPTTVAMLRTIGRLLVNIHGQHENQSLLSPERHVDYLEQLGGISPIHAEYSEAYERFSMIKRQLEQTEMDDGLKARRVDMLRYQIEEIESADLNPGEEDELKSQREIYRNAEKIAVSLSSARECLSGGEDSGGVLSWLSHAVSSLQDAGRYVEDMAELARRAESVLYDLEECSEELRDYVTHFDFEPGELEQVEDRLAQIHKLTSKYGKDEEEVLTFLEQARQELDSIEMSDIKAEQLKNELIKAENIAIELAKKLSEARRKAAREFEKSVGEQLAFLDMPGVRLSVSIEPGELGPGGIDHVEFLIAPNPGETPRPLSKIASGGELSRIMLAIKSVMAHADDIDTLVFDEIDTGISGYAAHKVGIKLRETSNSRQVICVTHLAQIGAQAHHHFLIEKSVREGRTYTNVTALDYDGCIRELARIIGGSVSPAALETAREMLSKVEK
ncbi:MAG TPA: DNA repair protein RecN [Ruminococcaceae bacterium]|nr:DNA repair protein RecN [Oscillospiraceae bacterium]